MFFGGVVVTSEDEGCVGSGSQERGVDDALDAGGDRGVYGGPMLLHPFWVLAQRYEEERLDPCRRRSDRLQVPIAGDGDDLGIGQFRRIGPLGDDQALADPPLGEAFSHPPPHLPGGIGVGDQAGHWPDARAALRTG